MSIEISKSIALPGIDKARTLELLVEFFTADGFRIHESSYNRVVFRRNGYGTWRSALSVLSGGSMWHAPMELEVMTRARPSEIVVDLHFRLGTGQDFTLTDLRVTAKEWTNDFLDFCNEWLEHEDQ